MGISAYIFAKNSKKCLYIDRRLYLLIGTSSIPWQFSTEIGALYSNLKNKKTITANELIAISFFNEGYWQCIEEEYWEESSPPVIYNQLMRTFARDLPTDEFYVLSSQDEPSCYEELREQNYTEVNYE